MLPEKHLKDLESSERKAKILENSITSILFLTSFVLLGPAIHEIGHLAVLESKNCSYIFNSGFVLPNGLHAEVDPLCSIQPAYLLIFYSAGYLATLSVGVILNITGSVLENKSYSSGLIALGTGMLLSVTLTIGVEGDIKNALEVIGLEPGYGSLIALLIVFGVFAASIHGVHNLLGLERKE